MNPTRKNKIISFILLMYTLVRRGIHFCYNKLIEPYSTTEDDRRHEHILNIILTGFIGLLIALLSFLIISHIGLGSSNYEVPITAFGFFVILFIGMLALSRKGYFKISTCLFILLYFILSTWGILQFGVELPLATLSYVVIIIISSILVSTRFSFIVATIVSITLIFLGYLQIHSVTNPDVTWKATPILLHDPIELVVFFFLIVILTWLSNREIENSLTRARKSEAELTLERDNLEIILEKRTREIKSLQAEKVAQLYRSAEFGRLSSGLFHDLMNPLNALIGNIDQMKSSPENIKHVETYIEKSVTASRRMGTFLESIRKQINRHALLELFSCDNEITEVVEILTYRAREAGVTLVIDHLDTIELLGNPLKFHQIAINLIANAIDAYKNTTSATRAVAISLTKSSHDLVFKVEDFGSGIPKDLLVTIFDPFFTTKDPHHGTGLGLSTTKTIVEQDFKGTIQVISIPNNGSIFTVTIPLV